MGTALMTNEPSNGNIIYGAKTTSIISSFGRNISAVAKEKNVIFKAIRARADLLIFSIRESFTGGLSCD